MSRQALCCALLVLATTLTTWANSLTPASRKQAVLAAWANQQNSAQPNPAPHPQQQPAYNKPPPGSHDITIGSGAGKRIIRVQDSAKLQMHGESSSASEGPYDPERMDFNKASSLSDKSFTSGDALFSKGDSSAGMQAKLKFNTHSFSTAGYNQSDQKFQTAAFSESSHHSNDSGKSFALPGDNSDANKGFPAKTSEYQDKTAQIAQAEPSKADPFAAPSSLNEKTFYDPMMNHVKHDPYATGLDVKRLSDLPNRPLTIKEVGDLINHEQIPDLNSDPTAEKDLNLNDPKWKPHEALRDSTPVAPAAELDKPEDLPAPGEMAQPPENSEPLPK
jgi:hypothetical protein